MLGVGVAACISFVAQNPAAGVLATIGALYGGMAAAAGVYHRRVRAIAASGLFTGLATLLGGLVGNTILLSAATLFCTALITALFSPRSRTAGTVGAQVTGLLCVVIGLRLPSAEALPSSLFVMSRAAIQFFLLTGVWRMKPGFPERRAVAEAFGALAAFVGKLEESRENKSAMIPNALPFQEARDLLAEAETLQPTPEHIQISQALRRAEILRATLVGFSSADKRYAASGPGEKIRANRNLRLIKRALAMLGGRVRRGRFPGKPLSLRTEARGEDSDYARWLSALTDLLRNCCDDAEPREEHLHPRNRFSITSLFSRFTSLPDTGILRALISEHALRYAVTVEVAFLLAQTWSRSHTYWLPMTVALVLRQGYGATFQRSFARLYGTILGLLIGGVIIQLFHPGVVWLEMLAVLITWLAFAANQASYAASTVAITGFVVFSLSAAGVATHELTLVRLEASSAGAVLALLSYILWPAWHWPQVWSTLRDSAQAQLDYALVVTAPNRTWDEIEEAMAKTRGLRIQSENLLESARLHPLLRQNANVEKAESFLQELEQNAAVILSGDAEIRMGRQEAQIRIGQSIEADRDLIKRLDAQF